MNYKRHTLCYLEKQTNALGAQSAEQYDLFYYWLERSFPFIFTRQPLDVVPGHIHLAIPYFKSAEAKKVRQSYTVPVASVNKTAELPKLQNLFPHLNLSVEIDIQVYGSHCWQYLTQEPYVQTASDVDLLVTYTHQSLEQLANLHQELHQKLNGTRIDGEIRFPQFGDCSWQELLLVNASDSILFKSTHNIMLLRRELLYATYPTLFS